MADEVTYTAGANSTPPPGTKATTDETTSGPHGAGSHMGIAKLAVSADGDSTHIPATEADGLLVEISNPAAGGGLTDTELRATPVPVSGTVAVTGGLTDAQLRATPVPVTTDQRGSTATRSQETGAADSQILAPNAARVAARFFNNADEIFYLGEGTAAVTASDFTMMLRPGEWYATDDFTGEYRGLFDAAVGSGELQVTEID